MKNIWNKITTWLSAMNESKLFDFSLGLIVASFVAILFGIDAGYCGVYVVFFGFAKGMVDQWQQNQTRWDKYLAMLLGGAIIQIFQVIGNSLG